MMSLTKSKCIIFHIIKYHKRFLNPILFDYDKHNIKPKAAFELDKLVAIMKKYPNMIIKVESHTDSRGSVDYNSDLSNRTGYDIQSNILTKKILAPDDWEGMLNLYRGSGLGLAHDLNQVGAFRPKNKDEKFNNLFFVGASTTPGTGLPMVVISSKLVTERITNEFSTL